MPVDAGANEQGERFRKEDWPDLTGDAHEAHNGTLKLALLRRAHSAGRERPPMDRLVPRMP